jgi:hypothetical protein
VKRFILGSFFGICAFAFAAVQAPQASAQTSFEYIVYNDTIYVYGRVMPKHTVIVDSNDTIKEISSNTQEEVMPTIYRERVAPEAQVVLSEGIYNQYKKLTENNNGKTGVLYKSNGSTSGTTNRVIATVSFLLSSRIY